MADERNDEDTPQGEPGAPRRGRLRRFFASKEGKLIGLGALLVALYFLVRHFGGQGQSAVNAAAASLPTLDTSGGAPVPSVPSAPADPFASVLGAAAQGASWGSAPSSAVAAPASLAPVAAPVAATGGIGALFKGINGVVQTGVRAVAPVAAMKPAAPLMASALGGPVINQATGHNYYHAAPAPAPHALAVSIASTQHAQAQTQTLAAAQRLRAGRGLILN